MNESEKVNKEMLNYSFNNMVLSLLYSLLCHENEGAEMFT